MARPAWRPTIWWRPPSNRPLAARALTALAKAGDLETAASARAAATADAAANRGGTGRGGARRPRTADERRWYARRHDRRWSRRASPRCSDARATSTPEPIRGAQRAGAGGPRFPLDELAVVVARLVAAGDLVERDGGYALAGAGDVLSPAHEALATRVGERLAAARFAPPTLASLEEELGAPRRDLIVVLEVLTRRGAVVRVDRDLWFDRGAVDEARERLAETLARLPQITLAAVPRRCSASAAGTPRRCSSSSTSEGLTRRRGDARVLRARR